MQLAAQGRAHLQRTLGAGSRQCGPLASQYQARPNSCPNPFRLLPVCHTGTVRGMPPSIAAGAASPSLLGREQELALLTGLLRDLERGTGTAVLIEGEPGIGKSTLVGALIAEATAPQALHVMPQVFRGTGD